MKLLSIDSIGGASGNMIMGALIDLGAPQQELLDALHGLALEPTEISIVPKDEHGQHGTLVTVHHDEGDHLPHRTLSDVSQIIQQATLSESTRALSLAVFQRLAEAEGRVHGKAADKIHFHEVGAIDAIIDIVGCCLALHLLGIEQLRVGPLPIGTGTIQCAHGIMPVPVPATVELLKGHTLIQTEETTELITPTGAALLSTWLEQLSTPDAQDALTLMGSGNGFGHKSLQTRANYIRASLFETEDRSSKDDRQEECVMLECNLDDMTPEAIGALTERLMAAGSLDVFVTPVQMKKQRPGVLLSTLCTPAQKARLEDIIFTESTTFGIREHRLTRTILDRRHETVSTPYGDVRIKIGSRDGKDLTFSPEFDDCLACAREHKVALQDVFTAARAQHAS